MAHWESANVKAQLRLSSQRLGQLQDRKDSQGQITRRDIATLLQQGNIELARAKVQNLMHEDDLVTLLGVLEMHVRLIADNFHELDQSASPSPTVVEAASSIIFASPHVQSRDLNGVRDLLVQRLGSDFAQSAIDNHDDHVSSRVIHALSAHPPSATKLDDYLYNIAKSYAVQWSPRPRRQDILNPLSEILDPASSSFVDLVQLRQLCTHGIPNEPPWLRPRIWKLFFGILPVSKASWDSAIGKQRESYYDLAHRLLDPLSRLPAPTTPLSSTDNSILDAFKQLSRISSSVLADLDDRPESSKLSPLNDMAPNDVKIHCSSNLDSRLRIVREKDTQGPVPQSTPEIRIKVHDDETPEISLSRPDSLPSGHQDGPQDGPTLLLPSNAYSVVSDRQKHSSTLLRLLYLHSCINPANNSPHLPSLLVPLYYVLLEEVDPQDAAHVEADTFWLFEAMVGEFSELEDEEGAKVWMRKFSERLSWADVELATNLKAKGLDPALPHYSTRWLVPLLTQTLPLSSVILVWDALFSCPMADRNVNPKLEYLLDFCTGMLIRARTALFRLGRIGRSSPGLWVGEHDVTLSASPSHTWQVGDVFLEGMSFLQLYPVQAVGGTDRLLQTASDLAHRRAEEMKSRKGESISLSARLKVSMWKSFTNHASSNPEDEEGEDSDEAEQHVDDGNDTETPQHSDSFGITSRLATTVWRGITNQSSMEVPPSPTSPLPHPPSPSPELLRPSPPSAQSPGLSSEPSSSTSQSSAIIWGYAEKLKDSDTAATLAKLSSNWRAKAMLGNWGTGTVATNPPPVPTPVSPPQQASHSLPDTGRTTIYSPPPRPTYFRPPRDSWLPQPKKDLSTSSPSSPTISSQSDSVMTEKKRIRALLAKSLQISSTPPKSGPRPLLLNSSSLITSSQATNTVRSAGSSPSLERSQWAEVMQSKSHRDSQSSLSSLSPDAFNRPVTSGPDWDSDSGIASSRVVPLNRRSVSPLAPGFKSPRRPDSASSSGASSDRALVSPLMVSPGMTKGSMMQHHDSDGNGHGWNSPVDLPKLSSRSGSPLVTPPITVHIPVRRGSAITHDVNNAPLEPPLHTRKLVRKKTPPTIQYNADDTSDSSVVQPPPKSPRTRPKKFPSGPGNPRVRDNSRLAEHRTSSVNSLTPEWPDEHEVATTPRASSFDYDIPRTPSPISLSPRRRKASAEGHEVRPRKFSSDDHEVRPRKISTDGSSRARKVSTDGKEAARRIRDSVAAEGDDEGYDDLLSAYESEDACH